MEKCELWRVGELWLGFLLLYSHLFKVSREIRETSHNHCRNQLCKCYGAIWEARAKVSPPPPLPSPLSRHGRYDCSSWNGLIKVCGPSLTQPIRRPKPMSEILCQHLVPVWRERHCMERKHCISVYSDRASNQDVQIRRMIEQFHLIVSLAKTNTCDVDFEGSMVCTLVTNRTRWMSTMHIKKG